MNISSILFNNPHELFRHKLCSYSLVSVVKVTRKESFLEPSDLTSAINEHLK